MLVATRRLDPPRTVAEEAEAELREQGPHSDDPILCAMLTCRCDRLVYGRLQCGLAILPAHSVGRLI